MPKITVYEAPDNLGLRPTEVGISATAAAARRVGAEYSDAAASEVATGRALASGIEALGSAAVKIADHDQISKGSAAFASFVNAKTKQWDEIRKTADPNDPTVAPRFLDQTEKQLEQFKSVFLTENAQQWAEGQTSRFRSHMMEKAGADMAVMAGQAAIINVRQTVNALSNTVRGDPQSLDYTMGQLDSSIDATIASSPTMNADTAGKVRNEILQRGREEIIKSAAMGQIEKTGEVPPWVSDPKYSKYIDGADLKAFQSAQRYYSTLNKGETRSQRAEREHNLKLDFNAKVNELELSLTPKNIGERVSLPDGYWDKLRELGRHPGAALDPGRLKTMISQAEIITERLNKPEPLSRISHQATMRIMPMLRDPNRTSQENSAEIYSAFQKGELNNQDFNFLSRENEGRATPKGRAMNQDRAMFWKRFGSVVDPTLGATPAGQQQLYFAEMDARRKEEQLEKQGLDPALVYDSSSPHYFGDPKNIMRYQRPLQELLHEQRSQGAQPAPAGGPPAPMPPPKERVVDQVYQTPKGAMRWKGLGWEPVK